MKKYTIKVKKIFVPVASLLWLLSFSIASAQKTIYQQAKSPLENMINYTFGGGKTVTINTGTNQDSFLIGIYIVINYLLTFIGIAFFAILIYGGYLWMFARGNEEAVSKAKKITTEAIIGIIIIVMARVLVEFILSQVGEAVQVQ